MTRWVGRGTRARRCTSRRTSRRAGRSITTTYGRLGCGFSGLKLRVVLRVGWVANRVCQAFQDEGFVIKLIADKDVGQETAVGVFGVLAYLQSDLLVLEALSG